MNKKRKPVLFTSIVLALILTLQFFPSVLQGASGSAEDMVKNEVALRIGSSKALVRGEYKYIDINNLNVIPFVKNNIPYAPLRFITEALGGTVSTNSALKDTYTVLLGGISIDVTPKLNYLSVNGVKKQIEAEPVIENDRLFIPVSSLAEALGRAVFFENGLLVISEDENPLSFDKESIDILKSKLSVLPSFGTKDELNKYISKMQDEYAEYGYGTLAGGVMEDLSSVEAARSASPSASPEAEASNTADFSEVNIQVKGVDEADIIRTDGKYIYALTSNLLVITEVYPASEMKVKSRYAFTQSTPSEMYVDGNLLTVISSAYINSSAVTYITVLDVSDKEKPVVVKETGINGFYLTSRKIGDNVYLITNTYINPYMRKSDIIKPAYYSKDKEKEIPVPDIYAFPGNKNYGYLTVAGISLKRLNDEPDISMYIGAGTTVYVSQKYMYITEPSYNFDYNETVAAFPWIKQQLKRNENSTIIHKFSLYDGRSSYIGSGAVPGYVLNQFSMDEYNSNFRIATNAYNGNNVYILNSQLKIKNSIEDIAPGERIYSTRFMGNRGYMVTFKNTDPLFVIDLNPENPQILGALKIPGYSDYLHPYDENTIIGIGKDTVESKGIAYYQGIKMAIFDITDVTDPIQKHVEIIGSRGTESELLTNHKALLFDKEKNLLAFPVTVYEGGDGVTEYGSFKFQGAYVYDISLEKGFVKRGEITHLTNEELKKSGNWYNNYYESSPTIRRIIYIGDSLYTLSDRTLKANDIKTVKYQNEVSLIK